MNRRSDGRRRRRRRVPRGQRHARAARRAPHDLTFTLDEATVEAFAGREPDWLAADRRAALALFGSLPIEPNQLYTTYLDLRAPRWRCAALRDGRRAPADGSPAAGRTAGLAELHEDTVEALGRRRLARGGRPVETPGWSHRLGSRAPARRLLADAGSLPATTSSRSSRAPAGTRASRSGCPTASASTARSSSAGPPGRRAGRC